MNSKRITIAIVIAILILFILLLNKYNLSGFSVNKYKNTKEVVYVFWTGHNKMTKPRKQCLKTLKKNIGVKVILVTPYNLKKFVVKGHPLHKSYPYLSLVHKADYLRTYFMHHHGGGYTDIKFTDTNWKPFFKNLNNDENKWCNGYTEIAGGSSSGDQEVHKNYKQYIGNGSYIFKPNTPITKKWLEEVNKKLDKAYPELKKHPKNPNSIDDILGWTHLLGDHFHDVLKPHVDKILHDLPLINTSNYR